MKNKIQKFSKGDFRFSRPEVIFDETNLVLIIGEGEVYRGSFYIRSQNDSTIRGVVYPSSFRIHFKHQGFEGNPARVDFSYDGRGLRPGHVEEGKLTVVCTGGEYEISFTAIIEKPYVMTTYGKVQSTDDFRKLAIKDFSEAGRLFRSKEFYEILKYENERTFCLYDNMRKWSLGEQAMEEFLVGIKQKECIFLTLAGEGMLFEDIEESTKGVLSLMKNTWGFMPVRIETEGDFLKVNRSEFTTEDFVGNTYEIEYYVRPEFLHGGRNYGCIRFVTPYEILTYEIEVLQNQEYDENHHIPELLCAQILKEYVGHKAGRIELEDWVGSATEKMSELRRMDVQNEMYQLVQANVYLLGNKVEEAKWILENYNYNRFAIGKDPITNCYYLYLNALIRENQQYTERVLDEIGKTYVRHQDSWLLLYMMIRLDSRYKNPYKRLEVLEQQFEFGIHEVLFYLEAYMCYQEKPLLLKKLGKFEIQILNFATKYRLITKELALYVSNFASQQKNFSNALFHILERLYKMYDETMILNTICTLLIKGNKTEHKYFQWYHRAVEAELKIAQLYEYYMLTLDIEKMRGPLPRAIYLYFVHGNTLDYKKAAFLYASLLNYATGKEELVQAYEEQMKEFAWTQLLKRHITDSLCVLYKKFCSEKEMTPEHMEAMRDVCFAYSIKTKVPNMHRVLVIEKDGSVTQKVPYEENGSTIIFLYDKEARVIWESVDGRYYTDSIPYETRRLFYEPRFLEMCKKYGASVGKWKETAKVEELTFENLRLKGLKAFEEHEVFRLCSRTIREENYAEDKFLLHLCFELFCRQQYDKVTLVYLANYYCGATADMKKLWKALKEYEIPAYKVGEKIITQMVFSEDLFQEEKIFEDYYLSDNVYFRVKQAYLAYVSKQYVVDGRILQECVFEIIANECEKQEDLPDICKIALLKYYAGYHGPEELEAVLHQVLCEMCEKQLVFPWYLRYKNEWLREVQLYDKVMIGYQAAAGNRLKLHYKRKNGGREALGYTCEVLMPIYENIYVKQFVLFDDEAISYYFEEVSEEKSVTTEKKLLEDHRKKKAGKYGKIDAMLTMSDARCKKAMIEFCEEERLAEEIYKIY